MHPQAEAFNAARVWAAIEDWLIPTLRLTAPERALYYHLVRLTHLEGRRTARISRRRMAAATGLATATARNYLRVLVRKRCIRFVDRRVIGSRAEVFLPAEIARRWARAPRAERLVFGPHQAARDAAGQPRAWQRTDDVRSFEFRARILRREAGRCFYCLRRLQRGEWTLDHVVPLARGGADHASNLVACCAACNWTKGLLAAEDFLRRLVQRKLLPRRCLRSRLRALARLRKTVPEEG